MLWTITSIYGRSTPDHPFKQVDEQWLKEVGNKLIHKLSRDETINLLSKLKQRHQSKQARALGIVFWGDIIALLDFDPKRHVVLKFFQ